MDNIDKIVDMISDMKVQDIITLVEKIEKKFNVSHDLLINENKSVEVKEERQSLFSVFLNKIGNNKLAIIKLVRAKNPNLGLKEAKSLVESCPVKLIENIEKEEAELFQKDLVEAGAEVLIK